MSGLFIFLFLLSLIILLIVIIEPNLLGKITKRKFTRLKAGILLGGITLALFILIGITTKPTVKSISEQKTETIISESTSITPTIIIDSQKEIKILQEQKAKSENLTKTAVNLITENKMSEAISLYNARWNELAKLRIEIIYDKELTEPQKKNIDNALKVDQEGITSILSQYEQLYR